MTDVGSIDDLPRDEPYPGVVRRAFDAQGATVTRYDFAPGASFALHRHPQEQITIVHDGSLRMTLGDLEEELTAGGWSVVAGGVAHAITAGPDGASFTAITVPRRAGADAYEEVTPS